jgi:hypothetical protein
MLLTFETQRRTLNATASWVARLHARVKPSVLSPERDVSRLRQLLTLFSIAIVRRNCRKSADFCGQDRIIRRTTATEESGNEHNLSRMNT